MRLITVIALALFVSTKIAKSAMLIKAAKPSAAMSVSVKK